MSFVISFQGQFKPYGLPDLSHYDHIHHVYRSSDAKASTDKTQFETELQTASQKKTQNLVGKYQKIEKEFHNQVIPHHARDIMNKGVKVLNTENLVADANDFLKKHQMSHIPILNSEKVLCGIVSDRDLIRRDDSLSLQSIMTDEVLTCFEMTRLQDIAKIMLHEKISAIPIINTEYKLTGIITKTDILNFLTRIISIHELI